LDGNGVLVSNTAPAWATNTAPLLIPHLDIIRRWLLRGVVAKAPNARTCGINIWLVTQHQRFNPAVVGKLLDDMEVDGLVTGTNTPEVRCGIQQRIYNITNEGKIYGGIT
jgi:hypothetical protein